MFPGKDGTSFRANVAPIAASACGLDWGLGFRVFGFVSRISGRGARVLGSNFRVSDFEFRVSGLGFGVRVCLSAGSCAGLLRA